MPCFPHYSNPLRNFFLTCLIWGFQQILQSKITPKMYSCTNIINQYLYLCVNFKLLKSINLVLSTIV